VQSQSSGVLFTANPLTGLRTEVVIDATFGLGEALVSGQVEPDHYIVDMESNNIHEKFLGSKLVSIESVPDGGVQTTTQGASDLQAVPDDVIHQLATTGEQIEKAYDFPQDIEWAWADDKIYVLQSRPITSLFPIPVVSESDQLHVYFSFGAVQGLLEPMTPLGQDAIRLIFAGGSSLFGFENRNQHTQGVIKIAGDRLWGDMTGVIRHPIGAKLAPKVFPGVEPGSLNALEQILSDPKIAAGSGQLRFRTFVRLIKFGLRMLRRMIHFARHPEDKANEIEQAYQENILLLEEKYRPPAGKANDLETNIKLFREIYYAFPYAVPEIMGGALPGLIPLLALSKFSKELHGSNDLAMELTRGLPNNVTTKMDLALWDTAKTIKANATAYDVLKSTPAEDLSQQYLQNQLPDQAQNAIGEFLTQYGMRGLGEIDIGRPRWRENPTQILKTIQSYLHIEDESLAPDAVFHRGEIQAEKALETLKSLASQTFGGKFKAKMIEALVRRLRALGGLRESPKFYIIQMMGIMRQSMLDLGQELVTQGKLTQPDDLFFLYLDELEDFSKGELTEWELLIRQRRDSYNREMLRKQIPRMLVSDGRTFYEGMTTHDLEDGSFKGSPVSPGVVEGTVKIVFNPHQAHLLPGEILVCPGTDPAWTPLFLAASGLVMEVGGLMTHGAIVAREYGIPAVVGVNQATEIFHDGDRIRINGSTGLIEKIG
ncbi:MAG: PEP/pyruvate-binding domain-containing protein, partial [Anaerolineales bacterium]